MLRFLEFMFKVLYVTDTDTSTEKPLVEIEKPGIEDDLPELPDSTTEEALAYIAGYIAYKLKESTPGLSKPMGLGTHAWINIKSRGYLTNPSNELLTAVKKFEVIFCSIHGDDVSRQKDPMGVTILAIQSSHPEWPENVIKLFVKIRFFHRIKSLNMRLYNAKYGENVRTYKQISQFIF